MYLFAFLVQDDLDSPSVTSISVFLSKNCALKLQDWVKGLLQIVKGMAKHLGSSYSNTSQHSSSVDFTCSWAEQVQEKKSFICVTLLSETQYSIKDYTVQFMLESLCS